MVVAAYVDDYIQIRVQHSSDNVSALDTLASLASSFLGLFGSGLKGKPFILASKKSTNWGVEQGLYIKNVLSLKSRNQAANWTQSSISSNPLELCDMFLILRGVY